MTEPAGPRSTRAVCLVRRPDGLPVADDFQVREFVLPALEAGQALVRNRWFSLDASARLRMDDRESDYLTPYALGAPLEGWAVGVVIASEHPGLPVGTSVHHALGWREHAVVEDTGSAWTSPRVLDESLGRSDAEHLGVLGPTGLTAWAGLMKVGALRAGDVVYVSAGAGSVGSLVVQLAKAAGHRVIASAGSASKVDYLIDRLGADAAFDYRRTPVAEGLAQLAPEGIDLYYDNVGGDHLDAALVALRPGGRVALCGQVAGYGLEGDARPGVRNLFSAIEKGLTLRGFLARMYLDDRPEFEREVATLVDDGTVHLDLAVSEGLDAAAAGLIGLLSGANTGKALVHLAR